MEHKFRTPVKCQNGHKAFWYWKLSKNGLFETKTIKLPESCECPPLIVNGIHMLAFDGGWSRDGDDQMFAGILSQSEVEIYRKDIATIFNGGPFPVDYYRGAFGYWTYPGKPYNFFVPICGNTNFTYDGERCNEIEVIGSTHLNPELIP